ncbi:HNH endonuclease [Gemmatimonadota bacterium]
MDFPFLSYSWEIQSPSIAIKHMDKSAFIHRGTAIPSEVVFFFLSEDISRKDIQLLLDDKRYAARIIREEESGRHRLFWQADLAEMIRSKFTSFHDAYSTNMTVQGVVPNIRFTLESEDEFRISLEGPIDTAEIMEDSGSTWSDQELEATIESYFVMLRREQLNEKINKAEVNRQLRSLELSERTKGSVEYRMQNISAVLQELMHPIIRGYVPQENVGSHVSERIRQIIFHKGLLAESDYHPTADRHELTAKVKNILRKGGTGRPKGQESPKRKETTGSAIERDPLVKAWILQNAVGVCELCQQEGPFHDKEGNLFLEVHHVDFLADGGADTVSNAVALCPNCHRMSHYSADVEQMRHQLRDTIERLS